MGWFSTKETFDDRLVKAFTKEPGAYPGLSATNIKEYVGNVAPKVRDTDRGRPAGELLSELLQKYPPSQWARGR